MASSGEPTEEMAGSGKASASSLSGRGPGPGTGTGASAGTGAGAGAAGHQPAPPAGAAAADQELSRARPQTLGYSKKASAPVDPFDNAILNNLNPEDELDVRAHGGPGAGEHEPLLRMRPVGRINPSASSTEEPDAVGDRDPERDSHGHDDEVPPGPETIHDRSDEGWKGWFYFHAHLLLMCLYQVGWSIQALTYLAILLPKQVTETVPDSQKGRDLGLVMLGGSVISIVGPPIIGVYSDRHRSKWGRRRPFMAWGSIVNAIGLVGSGFCTSIEAIAIMHLVVVTGVSLVITAFNATIPDLVEQERFGTTSGVLGALSIIGFALGTALGLALDPVGVAGTYALLAFVVTLTALVTLWHYKEPSTVDLEVPALRWGTVCREMWGPLMHHDFRWVCISRLFVQLSVYTIQEFLSFFVADVLVISGMPVSTETALLFLPVGGAAVISAVLVGKWSDSLGGIRKVFLVSSTVAMGIISFIMIAVRDFASAMVVCGLFGLALGGFMALDFALIYDVITSFDDRTHFARDLGVWHISVVFPSLFAAPLAGALLDHFNKVGKETGQEYLGYTVLFVFTGLMFWIASCCFMMLRGVK